MFLWLELRCDLNFRIYGSGSLAKILIYIAIAIFGHSLFDAFCHWAPFL